MQANQFNSDEYASTAELLAFADRKVLRLVLAFLKADIMIEGSIRHSVTGTPQGGIISPLLANVYLTAIDERYRRWG